MTADFVLYNKEYLRICRDNYLYADIWVLHGTYIYKKASM